MKDKEQEKQLSIKQSVTWNTWGNLFYFGVQWLMTVLVVRLIDYSAAGIYSFAMSVTNVFAALSLYGIRNYQISDLNNKYSAGDYAKCRLITELASLVLCTLFVVANNYSKYTCACIIAYMTFRLSESTFDLFSAIYQRNWRLDKLGVSLTVRSVILFAGFVIAIAITHSILVAFIVMSVLMHFSIMLYDYKNAELMETMKLPGGYSKTKALLIECAPLAVFAMFSSSIASIPRYFLDLMAGDETLGIYASVAAPTLIIQLVATNVFNPLLSAFSEALLDRKKDVFVNLMKRCIFLVIIIGTASVIAAKYLGRWGLMLLFGNSIDGYEYLLIPLVLCTIATAVIWFFSGILTVMRSFKHLIIGNALAAVSCALFSPLMIRLYEAQGATYALLAGNLLGIAYLSKSMLYKIKEI